jgi:DNA replication and repair protein RecF
MGISEIHLTNFRSFKKKVLEFSSNVTVIVGPNAAGKTNILESLFLLSTGKSFRASLEEEMVNYSADYARVKSNEPKLEVFLAKRLSEWPRKRLMVNGVPRRLIDFAGIFKTVLFGPWDMDLVTESPSLRRRFLDTVLSQTDREYRRASLSYEKGLRQRNRLLLRIREEGLARSQLLFWNQLLVRNGDYLSTKREELINFVNSTPPLASASFELTYDKSAISETRLEQYAEEEVAAATTLVGPHRDDFQFVIKNGKANHKRNLATYGSRGEQRMGVLWLKLAELSYIEKITGERPTLLLDDIFSELDHEHRKVVIDILGKQQTIITTADEHFVKGIGKANVIKLL